MLNRAYLDFELLFRLHEADAFFVTRAKSNADLRRIYSAPHDRAQGIMCDQTAELSGFYSHKHYPHHLRRIRFKDPEAEKTLITRHILEDDMISNQLNLFNNYPDSSESEL